MTFAVPTPQNLRSKLLRFSSHFYQLVVNIAKFICRKLIVLRQAPDPSNLEWAKTVLQSTLLRPHRVSARHQVHHANPKKADDDQRRNQLAQEILAVANHNWAQDIPIHCCSGPACCSSRGETVQKFCCAAVQGCVATFATFWQKRHTILQATCAPIVAALHTQVVAS